MIQSARPSPKPNPAVVKTSAAQRKPAQRGRPEDEAAERSQADQAHQDAVQEMDGGQTPAGLESVSLDAGAAQPVVYAQASTVVTDATTVTAPATVSGAGTAATAAAGLSAPVLAGAVVVGGAALGGGGGGGGGSNADTTAPNAPVIAVVGGNDIVSSAEKNAGVSVTGTAEAGSTVTVTWGAASKTATADNTGAYSVSFASGEVPADGATSVSATARDASGNTSVAANRPVTVDTTVNNVPVADGYIRGAAIWIDTNNDGTADYNTGLTTDAQGNFVLDADVPAGTIMAIGGVNIDTGIPNQLILRAPSGSTVINPLTTLLQNYIESSPAPITPETASSELASALGLTNGTDLTRFDPLSSIGSNALTGQRAAAQIASLLQLAAGSDAAAGDTILDNLSGVVRNAPSAPLNLGDLSTLNTALTGITPHTPANTILTTTGAIQNAGDLTAITQVQSQALDTTAPAAPTLTLDSLGTDNTPTVRVTFNTSAQDGTAAVLGNVVQVLEGSTLRANTTLNATDLGRGYVDLTLGNLGTDGVHTLNATLTDAVNLSGSSASVNYTLDTTPPNLAITSGNTTTDSTPVITGTGDNGQSVTVFVGGATYTTVVSAGAWSVDTGTAVPASGSFTNLDVGIHSVSASAVDEAGNSRLIPQTLTVSSASTPAPVVPTVVSVVISSVTGAVNNQLNAGDVATITVTFSEAVVVTGTPRVEVTLGSQTDYASYSTGSGQTSLQFTYTIPGSISTAASLFSCNPSSVDLNGSSLKDSDGHDAVLSISPSSAPTLYVVDTQGPVFTSASTATVAENTAPSVPAYDGSVAESDTGFTYSLSGADAGLFNIYSNSGQILFKTSPDYEAPADANSDNVYQVTLSVTDRAGNTTAQNLNISVTDDPSDSQLPIQSVIDLGAYGKLIQPYQVDQNGDGVKDTIYYYWDRSGDGTSASNTSDPYNGGQDAVSYSEISSLFHFDVNGNTDNDSRLDETYRYATLNGVKVAIPVAGSAIAQMLQDNQSYTGLAEFWDTYNTYFPTGGQPPLWSPAGYLTATPSGSSSTGMIFLPTGDLSFETWQGGSGGKVALEVFGVPIDTINPTFTTPIANTSFAENAAGTVLDANVTNDNGITYSLGGVDAGKFNINPSTGAISFKTAPDFEAPTDTGGNNVYDITVRGMELGGNYASQDVQITVTDVTEQGASYTLGQSQINLGSSGKLIHPVNVDGKWFYFWDRSGDGFAGLDDKITSHDVLDTVFRYDSTLTAQNTGSDTTDTFRFASLNGVTVGLPTTGTSASNPYDNSGTDFQNGTAIDNNPAGEINPTYNDLLAIWDAHNGTGTATNSNGVPSLWLNTYAYASASPVITSYAHAYVSLYQGTVNYVVDTTARDLFVAVQVL